MNVLIVTPYPPVLNLHGGGVRMYHNIRILAEKHRVRVLSFVENEEEAELLKSAQQICESITAVKRIPDLSAHWFSLEPFMVREFGAPAMHQAVDEAVRTESLDVIQCEYLQMAQYRRRGVFSILTAHEAYSANAYNAFLASQDAVEKLRLFSRWMAMLNYEISMCNAFDRVVTMTREDASYLKSYARHAHIRAIPIGVDAEYFKPALETSFSCSVRVVFLGNFRHTPNVEAAEFLLKQIAPHFPAIPFVIAGAHFPDVMSRPSNAVFPGYVADARQLLDSSNTIFMAPLFSGTGQRVKLLEAFAMGVPVITTPIGAAGFSMVSGEEVMIVETAEEFRTALAALASSLDLRSRLKINARRMIENDFSWDRIGRKFIELVEEGNVDHSGAAG